MLVTKFSIYLVLVSVAVLCGCGRDVLATKITYDWFANLTAGSLLPVKHLSQYNIAGQLAVYITDKKHIFQIEIIKPEDAVPKTSDLFSPFTVIYDDDIKFYTIGGDEISQNIQKSIASLFHLKKNIFDEGAFALKEKNAYGTCDVEYIVTKNNSVTTVKKLIDESSCVDSASKNRTNTPFFRCPSSFQEGISTFNEKIYTLRNTNNAYISEIKSTGSIHFQPFQALAEAHYTLISQLLKIQKIEDELEFTKFNTSMKKTSITYASTLAHDPFSGRLLTNKTELRLEINERLHELTRNLDWKLSTHNLDNQTSFHILEKMRFLDVEDWEELYQMISLGTSYTQETIQHFFWEFLPQVGSRASIIFIKNLITSKKITGFSASLLLITFPLHVKEINESFLAESEDFLHLANVEPEVKNAGILSFAVLIQKGCNDQHGKELQDRYTKYFLDKFMETSNHEDQMVYIQGLSNMQLPRTVDFLSPIITNPSYGRHIRYHAIWCTSASIEKQGNKVVEIFWPIFANISEPLEIRVSAMSILILTQPSSSRLLTFLWHMRSEPNYHIYNYFYTTVHSLANTKYPCYQKLRHIASQLSRYLLPRAYRWATGNYILDYEDSVRGYGGLINFFIVASEVTGLPSNLHVFTEQHSHGLSSRFSLHLKMEGVAEPIWRKIVETTNLTTFFNLMNISDFLGKNNFKKTIPEPVHIEIMAKIDGNTVYCKHINSPSFDKILTDVLQATALYYEFSVNYQRLRFPIRYEVTRVTDLGIPVVLQIRTSSLLSLRGRIKQTAKGEARNADLDFRYSMNTVTSLKAFSFFCQQWYGVDRIRSLHFRVPFSTNVVKQSEKSSIKLTIDRRNTNSSNGSSSGFVWHSTIKLFPQNNKSELLLMNGNNSNKWSMESRDLGARLEAKVFDCQGTNNVLDSLFIIKEAFQLSNKNYRMITGGVPILGVYSMANYFTFIPPGDSCGIILSMTPLQVQLKLIYEGWPIHLIMEHEKEPIQIWDLRTFYKDNDNEGVKKINFSLEHSKAEKNLSSLSNSSWRLTQFEGYLVLPSFRQGVLKAPRPIEARAKIAWGQLTQATSVELELRTNNKDENWPNNCENDTVNCLQAVSNLATVQTVFLNCINLPIWITTALLSIFPENVQVDKTSTNITFTLPARFPWTTEGECVINSNRILNFDNGTIYEYHQQTDCYSLIVLDCSENSSFIVGVRKVTQNRNSLELKIIASYVPLLISSIEDESNPVVVINKTSINANNTYQFYPPDSNSTNCIYQFKYWEKSKMVEVVIGQSGLILQYYDQCIVAIAEFKLRGKMCGLCGDFNGETSNDLKYATCENEFNL